MIRGEREGKPAVRAVPYPVRTARLLLRPLGEDDVEDIVAYRSRPDVCRWVPFDPMGPDQVLDRMRTQWALRQLTDEGQALTLGVELPSAQAPNGRGVVIGDVVLFWRSRDHAGGEIGYVLNPDYGGQGFATEAVSALLSIAFETYGFHRITARVDARNLASQRLAERVGMRQEAHLVENEWFKGSWSDEIDYAILHREWLSTRK